MIPNLQPLRQKRCGNGDRFPIELIMEADERSPDKSVRNKASTAKERKMMEQMSREYRELENAKRVVKQFAHMANLARGELQTEFAELQLEQSRIVLRKKQQAYEQSEEGKK